MWTKDNTEGFTADELIAANNIITAIIGENHDFDEGRISDALVDAYVKGNPAEEWEARTRRLLGL